MPTYRSINIALHSQFDVETIPEYYPLTSGHFASRCITDFTPPLVDDKTSTCSVYIPVLPGSTFWIGYSVSPPVPEGQYFLFKLYIDGAHAISWSTGKDEEWRGKTMFGLFEGEESTESRRKIEKRVLCFSPPNKNGKDVFDEKSCVEIRVHRAHGRKRIERQFGEYNETDKGVSRLVSAGRAGPEQLKRFYKFALIDPTNQPFATFRYYYRTWEQLRDLGLLEEEYGAGEENDLSVIEPEGAVSQDETEDDDEDTDRITNDEIEDENMASSVRHTSERCQSMVEVKIPSTTVTPHRQASDTSEHPRVYLPRGTPTTCPNAVDGQANAQEQRHNGVSTPSSVYRLSFPPSVKLDAPDQSLRPLPAVPEKSSSYSNTSYRPHPAYPVEEWAVRTPSPEKSFRDGVSTPPLVRKRHASSLMQMISSTWKRRGTPSAERTGSIDGVRSVTL
ncbi:hypothetical protein P153DRAFT_348103 [Dothidotthia symphoricarpi CBS 119687]|uniref:DUF7918 domain-containing protein n=1 Tax=Dothidotthia symphoricarpi CBS 119687 TaxID=1392245 RepID=A0A6A6A267_9PLEO|nr:uncharacterized protein P153DRAFT_348103 [Dothidotthia symphoricarpi CBS 119687]KAF2125900.1 hypothetical protein P153DRAFT_348103 [Dothidotthia symphoricarpi CBS 119687]